MLAKNQFQEFLVVPSKLEDITGLESYSLNQEVGQRTLFLENLFFKEGFGLKSRAGLVSKKHWKVLNCDEILNVWRDLSADGFFFSGVRQKQIARQDFSAQISEDQFLQVTLKNSLLFGKYTRKLVFSFIGSEIILNIKEDIIRKVSENGKEISFLFPFSETMNEVYDNWELLQHISIEVVNLYYMDETKHNSYMLKNVDGVELDFPFYRSMKIYQDMLNTVFLPGHLNLYSIKKNEENQQYYLSLVKKEISIKKRGDYFFSYYDPQTKILEIDYTPQYENVLIGENRTIKGYSAKHDMLFKGEIEKSIVLETEYDKFITISFYNVPHIEYDAELQSVPFIRNPVWSQIRNDFFLKNPSDYAENYHKIVIDANAQFAIPGLFEPNATDNYIFLDREKGIYIEPYVLNPDLRMENELNLWTLFYKTEEIQFDVNQPMYILRPIIHQASVRGKISGDKEVKKYMPIERRIARHVVNRLTIKLNETIDDNVFSASVGDLVLEAPSPVLSSLVKYGGYFYGVSNADIVQRDNVGQPSVFLFRTVTPGDIQSWYDIFLGNYLFINTGGFFTEVDYPVDLQIFNNKLLIIGTRNIQVWEVNNLPGNVAPQRDKDSQKLPESSRFLGKQIATLPIGIANKNLSVLFENGLYLITNFGLKMLNPFTLTGIPEIVNLHHGEQLFKNLLEKNSFSDSTFIKNTGKELLIKIGDTENIVMFSEMSDHSFSCSLLTSIVSQNLGLVENTKEELFFIASQFQQKGIVIDVLTLDDESGVDVVWNESRQDFDKRSIKVRWDFIGNPIFGKIWLNRVITVSYFLNAFNKELANFEIRSLRNFDKKTNTIVPLVGWREGLTAKLGKPILFRGQRFLQSKFAPIKVDGIYGKFVAEISAPFLIDHVIFGGTTLS